jgi:hypothetical protein
MSRFAPILALAACLGCAEVPLMEPQPNPPPNEGDWAALRDRATRSGKLYDGLATNAFLRAVYQSPEVRQARITRLAAWTAMTAAERDRLLAAERDEAAQYDDFLVSLFTPDRADNDLDAIRSIWRVALVVPGEGERLPVKVSEVKADSTLRQLYPAVGDFDVVYRVRFTRWDPPIAQRSFILRMAGARGRLDLEYGPGTSSSQRRESEAKPPGN